MLEKIPERYFEIAGTGFGLFASLSIAAQVVSEYSAEVPSTLSPIYSAGFLAIFIFWTLYGLRFKRPALWLTNGIAVLAQALLIIVTLMKQ